MKSLLIIYEIMNETAQIQILMHEKNHKINVLKMTETVKTEQNHAGFETLDET